MAIRGKLGPLSRPEVMTLVFDIHHRRGGSIDYYNVPMKNLSACIFIWRSLIMIIEGQIKSCSLLVITTAICQVSRPSFQVLIFSIFHLPPDYSPGGGGGRGSKYSG